MTDSSAFRRFAPMSGPLSKAIPDDALFGGSGKPAPNPVVIQELEQMAPEVEGALLTSMPRPPKDKKTGLPSWGSAFIAALPSVNGNTVEASKMVDRSFGVVYEGMRDYPDLAHAVADIKAEVDDQTLERLEAKSIAMADVDKNTTERIFQLNALNSPKYRPKSGDTQVTAISITVGVSVPKAPDFSQAAEIPAAVTVSEPTASEPTGEF